MNQEILLLHASNYNFKNDSGETVKGTKVWCYMDGRLAPTEDPIARDAGRMDKGTKPSRMQLSYEASSKIINVPGVYLATMKMTTQEIKTESSTNFVPALKIVDIEFMGNAKLQVEGKPK